MAGWFQSVADAGGLVPYLMNRPQTARNTGIGQQNLTPQQRAAIYYPHNPAVSMATQSTATPAQQQVAQSYTDGAVNNPYRDAVDPKAALARLVQNPQQVEVVVKKPALTQRQTTQANTIPAAATQTAQPAAQTASTQANTTPVTDDKSGMVGGKFTATQQTRIPAPTTGAVYDLRGPAVETDGSHHAANDAYAQQYISALQQGKVPIISAADAALMSHGQSVLYGNLNAANSAFDQNAASQLLNDPTLAQEAAKVAKEQGLSTRDALRFVLTQNAHAAGYNRVGNRLFDQEVVPALNRVVEQRIAAGIDTKTPVQQARDVFGNYYYTPALDKLGWDGNNFTVDGLGMRYTTPDAKVVNGLAQTYTSSAPYRDAFINNAAQSTYTAQQAGNRAKAYADEAKTYGAASEKAVTAATNAADKLRADIAKLATTNPATPKTTQSSPSSMINALVNARNAALKAGNTELATQYDQQIATFAGLPTATTE